jgi:predicted O-linked N-acetylglucosamine transferase (SPINDLY family)
MATAVETLSQAVGYHHAGLLQRAAEIYRQILQQDPTQADVHFLLGAACQAMGKLHEAAASLQQAVRLKPNQAEFHNYLGVVLMQLGRFDEATACYEHALRLEPQYAPALGNLGNVCKAQGKLDQAAACYRQVLELQPGTAEAHNNLAVVLTAQGKPRAAEASCRRALELRPNYPEAQVGLAIALRNQGKLDETIACCQQALKLNPNFAEVHATQGVAFQDLGRLDEAAACYRRALQLKPDNAEVHNNLGNILRDQGKLDDAVACYRRALQLKPGNADAYNNLGNALTDQGKLDEANAAYRRALELNPDLAEAHANLGIVLRDQGKLDEATACHQRAIALKPGYPEPYNNLGNAFLEQRKLDEAAACYRQALELKPDFAEAQNNLGNALKDQGKLEEAIACYRRAVQLRPDFAVAHSNLVYTLHFCSGYDAPAIDEEHRRWNRRHAEPLARFIRPHDNACDPHRRLRVGYLSPDFRDHCQSFFTVPLFSAHDHQEFEIFGYANVARPDHLTARLGGLADVWRNIAGRTDEQVAEMVRQDRIDILVDLTMHMAGNRLLVFARKPAPVQVCWLAYPGTTGLATIDYRLTDPHLDPPGSDDGHCSEQSLRLPDCFWCYDPLADEPAVNPLPALEQDRVTFGSLNNFCKVNAAVLKQWAEVLQAVPRSRLLMLAPEGTPRARTLEQLQREGIAKDRVAFVASQPRPQYLELYHHIDVGLDTFPYNGHTTSLDSFWMGVPVVTLAGQTAVGRAGACQLRNLGLPEWIATTPEQFVAIAVAAAGDLARLGQLRATLRDRMRKSPLMDAPRFARNIEAAYRGMWQRWCLGRKSSVMDASPLPSQTPASAAAHPA